MQKVYRKDNTPINLLLDNDLQLNGNCLKLPNGIMIEFGFISVQGTFEDKGIPLATIEVNHKFQNEFITIPSVVCTNSGQSGGVYRIVKDTKQIRSITMFGNNTYGFGSLVNYIAIGRWK